MDLGEPDSAEKFSEPVVQRESALGAQQLHRLLKGDGAHEVLPSARAWMKKASRFSGPQELLDALRAKELLPLENTCCRVLLEQRLLVSPERAVRRTQVQVAMRSMLYPGRGDFGSWLGLRSLIGILDGLDADMEEEVAGRPVADEDRGEFAIFRELFGIDPGQGRGVMLRFAALEGLARQLVFEIVAKGRSLTSVASELAVSVDEAERVFVHALASVGASQGEPAPLSAPWRSMLDDLMYEGEL